MLIWLNILKNNQYFSIAAVIAVERASGLGFIFDEPQAIRLFHSPKLHRL